MTCLLAGLPMVGNSPSFPSGAAAITYTLCQWTVPSQTVQLTHDSEGTGSPSWSPDGRRIAFSAWRDGDGEIYVMNPDGTNIIQLTDSDADEDCPELVAGWSKDCIYSLKPEIHIRSGQRDLRDGRGW